MPLQSDLEEHPVRPSLQLAHHPSHWTYGIVQHCTSYIVTDANEGQAPRLETR